MNLPYLSGLRRDVWAQSSTQERIEALQELNSFLASQDNRSPCLLNTEALGPNSRGAHFYNAEGVENIVINSDLIESTEPYQAVETLFHEDRHAHQHHIVNNPELAESETQLQDWKMSYDGGYIQPEELNFSTYRTQPTEIDANQAARANTDSFYQDVLQDTDYYSVYKGQKELELQDDLELAQFELGEDYEEEARQAVRAKYQAQQDMQQEQSTAQENGSEEISEKLPDQAIASVDQHDHDVDGSLTQESSPDQASNEEISPDIETPENEILEKTSEPKQEGGMPTPEPTAKDEQSISTEIISPSVDDTYDYGYGY